MKNSALSNIMMVPKIEPFEIVITKGDIIVDPSRGNGAGHIHSHYEIFINVCGNIDFIVNNKIYTLSHGDIVLIAPNTYHHSIYKHPCHNVYYYIFFPAFNDALFSALLNSVDSSRLISLPSKSRDEFINLCGELIKDNPKNDFQYLEFFIMLNMMNNSRLSPSVEKAAEPHLTLISDILNYINDFYPSISGLDAIANEFHISLKTLERLFKTHLDNTPKSYIDMFRLSKASEFLRKNSSVTDACYKCGFQDCSQFIKKFKRQFGETPFQYKKRFLNSINNAYYLQNNSAAEKDNTAK